VDAGVGCWNREAPLDARYAEELSMTFSAPLPDRFDDVLDWFVPLPSQEPVAEWVAAYDGGAQGFSLLGPPGSGKTASACWAARSAEAVTGVSVGYVTSLKYQHALQARMSLESMAKAAPPESLAEVWERHENVTGWTKWLRTDCDLLVFDDWGKEHTTHTRFIEDEIEFLLRDRFDHSLPTLLTSNMGLSSIKTRFGDAMSSFIHEAFPPIAITGDDRRRA